MATDSSVAAPSPSLPKTTPSGSLKLLDGLIQQCYNGLLQKQKDDPKLGDFLKMIELRRKLTPHDESQKELWDMLEKVRQEVLASNETALSAANTTPEIPPPSPLPVEEAKD